MDGTSRKWTLALGLVAGLLCSRLAFSCGPFLEKAIFTYTLHPDLPLISYAQGQLGVLQPTYAQSYLYVAYRYLSGLGFDQEEQQALLALWDERLHPQPDQWDPNAVAALKTWSEARARSGVDAPAPPMNVLKTLEAHDRSSYYQTYVNCTPDAFVTAARTLTERIEQFGVNSAEIQRWVQAQDQVFANCSGPPAIPPPAAPQSPDIIQKDRAYQIAAAHFYAGDLPVAGRLFRDIAADPTSPWRTLAPYLVARTLLRQGSLIPGYHQVDKAKLAEAQQALASIIADQSFQSLHAAARRLLAVVRFRLEPNERLHELAQSLISPQSGPTLKQHLWDYTLLLDRLTDEPANVDAAAARRDDLTDWILTFQDTSPAALEHALQRWAELSTLPWLVASLTKIGAEHPRRTSLLQAAEKVPAATPAFATVIFHRLRLLAASGRRDEARQQLDQVLAQAGSSFPASGRNLMLALRMKLARSMEEFITYAPRIPVALTYNIDGRELPENLESGGRLKLVARDLPLFDVDATRVLNRRLPLETLRWVVHRNTLPVHLRREVAIAVLARSLLLREEDTTRDLVSVVKSLVPELGPYLDEYRAAVSREARAATGLFMLLRFPGLKPEVQDNVGRLTPLDQIDNFRDNWWCALDATVPAVSNPAAHLSPLLESLYRGGRDAGLEFLSAAQMNAAQQELQRLASVGAAPNYLSQQAIAWSQRSGSDPRVPEALHLAVRAARYGCTNADTGKFSKAAFELLHEQYPKTPWAQKTKYWYK